MVSEVFIIPTICVEIFSVQPIATGCLGKRSGPSF